MVVHALSSLVARPPAGSVLLVPMPSFSLVRTFIIRFDFNLKLTMTTGRVQNRDEDLFAYASDLAWRIANPLNFTTYTGSSTTTTKHWPTMLPSSVLPLLLPPLSFLNVLNSWTSLLITTRPVLMM